MMLFDVIFDKVEMKQKLSKYVHFNLVVTLLKINYGKFRKVLTLKQCVLSKANKSTMQLQSICAFPAVTKNH